MKKLFRVFCLIGIVFFLGVNEGYAAMRCDDTDPWGGVCDSDSAAYGFTVHRIGDGTKNYVQNDVKVYEALCVHDNEDFFCEYTCLEEKTGMNDSCAYKVYSHESNIKKFWVRGWYYTPEKVKEFKEFLGDINYSNYNGYKDYKLKEVIKNLEKAQCDGYSDCLNYLENNYCKKYGEENSLCATVEKYVKKEEQIEIKDKKKSCKISFKYDNCGVYSINGYFVYSNGSLTLKDIDSYDKDSNKIDIKEYSDGKITIENYVTKYKDKTQCINYYNDQRDLNYFHKADDLKTFKTNFIEKLEETEDLECPSYVWCGERTSSGVENDFYLVLKDDLNMNNKDTCISKGYSEDATVIGFNEDGTLDKDKITVDDIKNFYIKEYGNFIDVNKPIDFANCEELLSNKNENAKDVINLLKFLVWAIRIIVPLLMIALGCLDFAKAVFAGEDNMKKAQSKFVKRVVISVAIMLIPSLLKFILTIAGGIWPDTISPDLCGIL